MRSRNTRSWVTKTTRAGILERATLRATRSRRCRGGWSARRAASDVRLRDERAGQQHAPAPAAGQRVDGHVARQAEAIEDHLDALLDPPAVPLVELVLQPAEALEGRGRGVVRDVVRRVVIRGDHVAQRAEALGDDVEHRRRGRERHVLLEARDDARRAGARRCRRPAAIAPATILSSVDLPVPLRPMTATRSPGSTWKATRSRSGR